MVNIGGAGDLNRALQLQSGNSPNIASRLLGAYGEVATRVSPDAWTHELVAFGRYELFDTQHKMPDGFLPLEELQRSAVVIGATYFPDPDVAFKFDVSRNATRVKACADPGASISVLAGGFNHDDEFLLAVALVPQAPRPSRPSGPRCCPRHRGTLRLHAF